MRIISNFLQRIWYVYVTFTGRSGCVRASWWSGFRQGHRRRKGEPCPLYFENFSKNGCFLTFEWEKTSFTTFSPPRKISKKSPNAPLEKILPTAVHGKDLTVKFLSFCRWNILSKWSCGEFMIKSNTDLQLNPEKLTAFTQQSTACPPVRLSVCAGVWTKTTWGFSCFVYSQCIPEYFPASLLALSWICLRQTVHDINTLWL